MLAQSEENVSRLLEAGERLLVDCGYPAFSLDAVAETLGCETDEIRALTGVKDEFVTRLVRRVTQRANGPILDVKPTASGRPEDRLH
jgi:AcrR family transcriptional regulator